MSLHHRPLAAAEADDVAVGVLHVEIFRPPLGRRQRLQNRDTVGDALVEEGFNTIDAGCRVEVFMVAPESAIVLVSWRFLEMQLQPVDTADGVKAFPRLAECEAELLVVRHRTIEVIDKKLWSEGGHARFHGGSHWCLVTASSDASSDA